jgi:hypothetical protein
MVMILAHATQHEALIDKVQAMGNVTNTNPLITEKYFFKFVKELQDKLDEEFGTLIIAIDTHMDRRHEATMATITHHTANLQELFGALAFKHSNIQMQGIVHDLATLHTRSPTKGSPTHSTMTQHESPLPCFAPLSNFKHHRASSISSLFDEYLIWILYSLPPPQ